LGYVEGETIRLEYRSTEADGASPSSLAAELVALPVDVIATGGYPAILAARQATSTIPSGQAGCLSISAA
jgi:hypothetical protein